MENVGLLIGCPLGINPRVNYALQCVFNGLIGVNYSYTGNMDEFHASKQPKIYYGSPNDKDIPHIPSSNILYETGIKHPTPRVEIANETFYLFYMGSGKGRLVNFDIFSAVFWMLSRYEEYQNFSTDKHGRYKPENSLLATHNMLQTPIVDIWVEALKQEIKKFFPGITISDPEYKFVPTIDADSVWAYKQKPLKTQIGGGIKEFFTGKWRGLFYRIGVHANIYPDPFDTWETIDKLHTNFPKPLIFFLMGKYGKYNKNIGPENKRLKTFIKERAKMNQIGIHPSYYTSENSMMLKKEISALSKATNSKIAKSRQHFLKFTLPETYNNLVRFGITEDYSMGYASTPGFRAGTCKPFYFYDLLNEMTTPLRVFPITVMDGTLNDYMKLAPQKAKEEIQKLAAAVKKVNGVFVSLWHNESFSERGRWKGWIDVYKFLLNEAGKQP